jgi:hypothetical protein
MYLKRAGMAAITMVLAQKKQVITITIKLPN